jgi:hypothetical protein
MGAWQRKLNDPVSPFPVDKAGPAHIAMLKTFIRRLPALGADGLQAPSSARSECVLRRKTTPSCCSCQQSHTAACGSEDKSRSAVMGDGLNPLTVR